MPTRIKLASLFFSIFLSIIIFNNHAQEVLDLNAQLRVLLTHKTSNNKTFDQNGIPTYLSSRIGHYTSPFYVVHYGLQYSQKCINTIPENIKNKFHWKDDPTNEAWHNSPLVPSLDLFKHSSEWVLKNISKDENSNSHLFYYFNWPYPRLIGGQLTAPWWSGLTDGHAITLMLRAYDCFGDQEYLKAAASLYSSTLTSFSEGGSLIQLNGLPWIEEYVDPTIPEESLSRVFNGMAYAYFGIKAYEEYFDFIYYADKLKRSIIANINVFSMGNWSYYDAIKSPANLKYHRVNLELLKDQRLYDREFDSLIKKWTIGSRFPIFYFIYSENSISKLQFYLSFFFLILIIYFMIFYFLKKIKK